MCVIYRLHGKIGVKKDVKTKARGVSFNRAVPSGFFFIKRRTAAERSRRFLGNDTCSAPTWIAVHCLTNANFATLAKSAEARNAAQTTACSRLLKTLLRFPCFASLQQPAEALSLSTLPIAITILYFISVELQTVIL